MRRSEIEAGESALEGMESGSSDALSKCKEAEARLKVVEDALAEKDGMIKYVGEEVERVKGELSFDYFVVCVERYPENFPCTW